MTTSQQGGLRVLLLAAVCTVQAAVILLLVFIHRKRWGAERIAVRRHDLQMIVADLSVVLMSAPVWLLGPELRHRFQQLIEVIGFDCVLLIEFGEAGGTPKLLHSRIGQDASLSQAALDGLGVIWADAWIKNKLTRSEAVFCETLDELADVSTLNQQLQIASFGILPLRANGSLFGALLFVAIERPVRWATEETAALQTVADIVASALKRQRFELASAQSEQLNDSVLRSLDAHVAVVNRDGTVIAVNERPAELCCNPWNTAPVSRGRNYLRLCEHAVELGATAAGKVATGIVEVLQGQKNSFRLEYPCGRHTPTHWFSVCVTPLLRSEGGAIIRHESITEQKESEMKLRESEDRFRRVADTAPVMIWMSGPNKLCNYFNEGWLKFTGRSFEKEIGDGWIQGVHITDVHRCMQEYNAAFDARVRFTREYRLRRADGEYRWVSDSAVPLLLEDGRFAGYIGCSFDITDRRESAAARALIGGRLLRAQEEERARIARDLHDDVGQRLALIAIMMEQMQAAKTVPLCEADQAGFSDLLIQVNEVATDISRISHSIHPSKLRILGLAAAVRGYCNESARSQGITVEYRHNAVPANIDPMIALALFRIVQEALRNIAKHSHAKKVNVELAANENEIQLSVQDDGVGFDAAVFIGAEGLGLISMQERIRLVGGQLIIWSKRSEGTRIVARVPLTTSESCERMARGAVA